MLWNSVDLRKRRLRHVGAALSIVAALTAAHAPAFAQQKTQLRVAYIPVITWLPALVAKD
jgi:ABC-type nitrate/sulfonate/bicarbonate transport system substrate-binding protein